MGPQPLTLPDKQIGASGCGWLTPALEMAALASGNWPPSPDAKPMRWTCFPRVATRRIGSETRSVHMSRDFSLATARRWGVACRSEDIEVVVSELVTNALRYGCPGPREPPLRWPIRLGLAQPGPWVVCAVADPSTEPPVPKELGCLAESGRGLHVIAALSDHWGFTTAGSGGKVVWALVSASA